MDADQAREHLDDAAGANAAGDAISLMPSIAKSRSASSFFSLLFSDSSTFKRFASDASMAPKRFFHEYSVWSLTPYFFAASAPEPAALEVFQNFKDLRNKHIVHDENSYAQSIPGAVLNEPREAKKVEAVVCFRFIDDSLTPETYSNLKLLVDRARAWVTAEFDSLCEVLTTELEAEPYDGLLARENMTYSKSRVEDMGQSRRGRRG